MADAEHGEAECSKKPAMTDEERLKLAEKLDRELDEFISGLGKKPYKEGWPEENWQEEFEKHPFFMKTAPKPGEEVHPLYEGLQKLKYDPDENTAEELATSYKEDGNFNFKHKNYRLAILSYTEGIKTKCGNADLESALLNNRSAAHYCLKNYRSSLRDCELALKLKPDYDKVLVRAANCCYELKQFDAAIAYCDKILEKQPNDVIAQLKKNCLKEDKLKQRDSRKREQESKKRNLEERLLLEAIQRRRIKCEPGIKLEYLSPPVPQLEAHRVYLNSDGELVWPVTFVYPEYKVMDFVQGFNENERFNDHLERMFNERPDWDVEKKYAVDNLVVYHECSNQKLKWVDKGETLGKVLQSGQYVVKNGVPSFIILVHSSEAQREFTKNFEVYR